MFQSALESASGSIYSVLDGEARLGKITVQVPETWTETDCGVRLPHSHHHGVRLLQTLHDKLPYNVDEAWGCRNIKLGYQ